VAAATDAAALDGDAPKVKTLRRYLWVEIATATGFVLFALLSLFTFFDLVAQLDEIGRRGFQLRHALSYVAFTLPSRMYELMPIAAIGTIYALSKLAGIRFTIMRVSGMGTRRLLVSLLAIGFAMVVVTFLLGEVVAPPSSGWPADRLKARWAITVRDFLRRRCVTSSRSRMVRSAPTVSSMCDWCRRTSERWAGGSWNSTGTTDCVR
jgi:lipopolysaccharide export system permease protein